ncbi:MAG TPA: pentapeptide repeat-containing protein, partial [Nannocystaceae bacterium]|nr:pentapeptide repeat-containing protein [Nannocystaceae bacterium]
MNRNIAELVSPDRHPNDVSLLKSWLATLDRDELARRVAASTRERIEQSGRGLDLSDADFHGADLSGLDLRHAIFSRTNLCNADLSHANLESATMICPLVEKTRFDRANLGRAYIHAFAAQVASFVGADLRHVLDATGGLFHGCNMTSALLDGAKLSGTTFYQTDLSLASLRGTELVGGTINECVLTGTRLDGARLAQVTITKCHVEATSFAGAEGRDLAIQRCTAFRGVDMTHARLRRMRLAELRVLGLRAPGIDATEIDVGDCTIDGADLTDAVLEGARIVRSHFAETSCVRAQLGAAAVRQASFVRCDWSDVAAENASIVESSFAETSFRRFSGRGVVMRDCDAAGCDFSGAYLYRAMLTGDPQQSMNLRGVDLEGANIVQAYIAADLAGANLRR